MPDIDELRSLVGKMPGGGVPAAWWTTTNAEAMAEFDRWSEADLAYRAKIEALGKEVGCDKWMRSGYDGTFRGFIAPPGMGWRESHPDYLPIPEGWRIDKKDGRLLPRRRTKADRESEVNQKFDAIGAAPRVLTPGMPREFWIGDHVYGVTVRRGDACLMAFSGGDPDRLGPHQRRRDGDLPDESIWTRQPLSAFHLLREGEAA